MSRILMLTLRNMLQSCSDGVTAVKLLESLVFELNTDERVGDTGGLRTSEGQSFGISTNLGLFLGVKVGYLEVVYELGLLKEAKMVQLWPISWVSAHSSFSQSLEYARIMRRLC